jgi:pimeloyl-ACP methyl ester carboxylesterase
MPLHKINGQWIHYEDFGGNQPPLVLAHGLLMDSEMFAPQLEALGSRCRIITWDARCHGETETTADPFTYWDLAEDLRGLLDHLGIAQAVSEAAAGAPTFRAGSVRGAIRFAKGPAAESCFPSTGG